MDDYESLRTQLVSSDPAQVRQGLATLSSHGERAAYFDRLFQAVEWRPEDGRLRVRGPLSHVCAVPLEYYDPYGGFGHGDEEPEIYPWQNVARCIEILVQAPPEARHCQSLQAQIETLHLEGPYDAKVPFAIDLSPLARLPHLRRLSVQRLDCTGVGAFSAAPALRTLAIHGNVDAEQLVDLPVEVLSVTYPRGCVDLARLGPAVRQVTLGQRHPQSAVVTETTSDWQLDYRHAFQSTVVNLPKVTILACSVTTLAQMGGLEQFPHLRLLSIEASAHDHGSQNLGAALEDGFPPQLRTLRLTVPGKATLPTLPITALRIGGLIAQCPEIGHLSALERLTVLYDIRLVQLGRDRDDHMPFYLGDGGTFPRLSELVLKLRREDTLGSLVACPNLRVLSLDGESLSCLVPTLPPLAALHTLRFFCSPGPYLQNLRLDTLPELPALKTILLPSESYLQMVPSALRPLAVVETTPFYP